MKQGKQKKLLIPILLIALALVLVLYLSAQKDLTEKSYLLKANVTELRINDSKILVGVSNDPTELNFGAVSVNMTVQKFLNLTNNRDTDAVIKVIKSGNIIPYITVSEEEFLLKKGENKEINIIFNGTSKGVYTGVLVINAITPKYSALAPLSLWK